MNRAQRVETRPLRRLFDVMLLALAVVLVGSVVGDGEERASAQGGGSSGLVAAYGFEERSGTGVVDSSAGGNDGTISGADRVAGGRFGRALSFDGNNDMVTVPDSDSLDLSSGMTLASAISVSFRSVAFSSLSVDSSTLAQSERPS